MAASVPNIRQTSGLDMWRTWETHYRRTRTTAPVKRGPKLRAKQEIKRNWNAIGDRNRIEGLRLKRSLCNAIYLANIAQTNAATVDSNFQADQRAATWQLKEQRESTEDLLREKIRYLEALTTLIRVEDQIGDPAAVLRTFDGGRRRTWIREQIEDISEDVIRLRQAETRHLNEGQKLKAANKRRDAYLRLSLEPGEAFVPFDGGHSDSKLGFWIRSDGNRNISDRLVVKDVCFDMKHEHFWSDTRMWQNVEDPLEKELTEAFLMKRLQESQSPNVVRLRESRLHASELLFRMFIEYCPYGDAHKILKYHTKQLDQPVPEPLIWHFFESLVNAGLIMQQGHATQLQPGWREVVHMDIKPANVFIGPHPTAARNGDNWAAYPTFKLGDYGLAFETWLHDHDNPRSYLDTGTTGYMAPEQVGGSTARLTAKTNVFGVGITVMTMMSRHRQPGVRDEWAAARKGSRADEDHPCLRDSEASDYSDELVQLVTECVSYLPRDRPTFEELRDTISEYTRGEGASQEDDLAQGMRLDTVKRTYTLGLTGDPYPVDTSIDAVDQGNDSSSSSSSASASDEDRTPIRIKLRRKGNI